MKKFLIGGLTVFTLMWAMGLSLFVTVPEASAAVGDLVKSASSSTVYVVGADGVTIMSTPHSNVYSSWGYPADFSTVMTKDLSSYTVGNNVEFRDASLVKGDGAAVYLVYNSMKRPIVSDVVFLALGYDWDKVTWLSDAFLADYTTGSDVDTSTEHPDGQLVKYASSPAVYLIDGGTKRAFDSAATYEGNRYAWGDVITIPDTETYPDGALVAGYEQALSLPAGIGSGATTPVGSGLTVALSPATPASTSIIADSGTSAGSQALVPFTTVNFTAASDGDVTVNTLLFKRTGISTDSSLENLYLYDGSTKLTDGGSLSSAYVTFNNASGLFTVPAGTTKSITVKGDLALSLSSGQTIGFELVSASDVTTDGAAVNGSFPATGNMMTIATVTDLGKMQVTVSAVSGTQDPDTTDVRVFQANFVSANQKMSLEYLKFTNLGSVLVDDLSNFKLYNGGTLVATTAAMNSDRELIFDLAGAPINFTTGQTKTLKVFADVDKGSTRTYNFTLQEATDVVVKDTNYDVYVMPYPTTVGTWAVVEGGSVEINAGSLSVVKATDSPSGNVSKDATNVSIGMWDLKATGEDMKVKNFDVNVATTLNSEGGLDNGKVFYNGVQVGSTKDLTEATDVNFTFGSSLIVPAGTTGSLEVKADMKTATSAALAAASGNTIVASIGTGSTNVQKMSSLAYGSYPSTDKAANSLSVQTGSLAITEYAGYGDQTMVAGTVEAKVASAVLTSGSAEGVNITSLTVALDATEYNSSTSSDLLLKDDQGNQLGVTRVAPGSSNIFSVNFDIPASGSKIVEVYTSFTSSANAGEYTANLAAEGSGLITSNSISGSATDLQTITLGTGSLSATTDASQPSSDIILAGTTKQFMNAIKFSALYEDFEVQELTVVVDDTTNDPDNLGKIYLEYPTKTGTGTAEGYLASGSITFTGINFYIARDNSAVLKIYSDVTTISAGADSGDEFSLDFDVNATYKHIGLGSGTTETTGTNVAATDVEGSNMVLRKTRPTFTNVSLPASAPADGNSNVISKFTVAAEGSEDVSLYQLEWDVSTSGLEVTAPVLYDGSDDQAITASSTTITGSVITISFTTEEVISAGSSKTFYLKATIANSGTSGDSVATNLATPYGTTTTGTASALEQAGNVNIIWSDNSATPHSQTSSDWCNSEFVKTLPSNSQTLLRP